MEVRMLVKTLAIAGTLLITGARIIDILAKK